MKFGIDIGHNCPPWDTGAVGFKKEDDLAKDVGTRLIKKLSAAGHSVINCTPSTAAEGESLPEAGSPQGPGNPPESQHDDRLDGSDGLGRQSDIRRRRR